MLKKLLAMVVIAIMCVSCFAIAATATDYGYDYGELICGRAGDTTLNGTYSLRPNYRTYMRQAVSPSVESAMGKYYLYDNITGNRMGDDYFFRLNNQTKTNVMKFHENGNVFELNVKDYAGKNFYSKSNAATARIKILKPSSGTMYAASTQTWNFKIAYNTTFANTWFTACAGSSGNRNMNLMRITETGLLKSGNHAYDTENVMQLETDREYKIGIVIKYIPTATTAYNYTKSIYVDDVLKYHTYGARTITPGSLTFNGIHIDTQPWTIASTTGVESQALNTAAWSNDKATEDTQITSANASSLYKYTLLDTKITIDEIEIYAGDKYAQDAPSLADATKKFHITSNVRKDTNYVTVAADAGTATAAKAILATYNGEKLVNVKTQDLTLSAAAITETDIELTNAGATSKKLFILDGLGNLKPLAADIVLN